MLAAGSGSPRASEMRSAAEGRQLLSRNRYSHSEAITPPGTGIHSVNDEGHPLTLVVVEPPGCRVGARSKRRTGGARGLHRNP